jgi:serine/threonine protein phosphatase PrpC
VGTHLAALEPRRIETAARSDTGRVRDENQDFCAEFEASDASRLLVVADGMGGHNAGGLASRVAVAAIGEVFRKGGGSPEELLKRAFGEANARVHFLGAKEPFGMGTTAVALLLRSDGAWVAHVGDSRAYRWRAGSLERLTEDHSWVFQEVAQGRMTAEQAVRHPRRNAMVRTIGLDPEVPVEVARLEVAPGDRALLCSDGLWDELDEKILADALWMKPAECVRHLVELANLAGGHDNITAAVARVPESRGRRRHAIVWPVLAAVVVLASVARWCGA